MSASTTHGSVTLFRRILRLHRSMPPHLRSLGDKYVAGEFRLHQKTDKQDLLAKFNTEWGGYAKTIENELSRRALSASLGGDEPEKKWGRNIEGVDLTDEQKEQLAKLKAESLRQGGSEDEEAAATAATAAGSGGSVGVRVDKG